MKVKIIAAAVLLAGIATNAHSQSSDRAETKALLVAPIKITKLVDMHFGTVAASGTAGTVTLNFADFTTASGGASVVAGAAVTPKTAQFEVEGQAGLSFAITLPTAAISLTYLSQPPITVDNFTCDAVGNTAVLEANGKKLVKVGAVLDVPANTLSGLYENASDLIVIVNYN